MAKSAYSTAQSTSARSKTYNATMKMSSSTFGEDRAAVATTSPIYEEDS